MSAGRLPPLSIRHVVATPLIVLNLNKSREDNGFMALLGLWILLAAKSFNARDSRRHSR